ncbi:DNA-directed DNA/RNA polymerase mu [Megalops cyprinoides]|uniref:DNA-directed DNA/RNA polymerase mu n=1 Tax=Megalops cyprinoides TaxID=118141 RepID=UPI001865176A|nr:DNA-directed DNA/RNA polymerase mu [Megalops cyprinoides]
MVPLKRRKTDSGSVSGDDNKVIKFPNVVIFLLERKMGSSRKAFLTRLGRRKGFRIEESYSQAVTHVVSENNSGREMRAWLESQAPAGSTEVPVHLLDISWFTESMRAGRPVDIQDRHRLQVTHEPGPEAVMITLSGYACQRRTPLQHHNTALTEALLVLAENAEFCEDEGRNIAFKRAASVLKALPQAVCRMGDLQGLPCLGEHSQRVIKEILEDGKSREVETTLQSEQYQAMKSLTGIFGVGVKTADRWFREGLRQPSDVAKSGQRLNHAQQAGLQYYNDLNTPVTKAEADVISRIVEGAVQEVLPGAEITLTGGFRRGKQTGHDVDFLITHPEEGREEGLLTKVVSLLETRGLLLYQKTTRNSYLETKEGPACPPSNMDRFERCFSIFRLERPGHSSTQGESPQAACEERARGEGSALEQLAGEHLDWKAVRVDLVVTPVSQFAFALLGWTGSQLFERELRRWAGQEKSMSLSSHALFDNKRKQYLRASSEEEIFAHLGLAYIPPCERNA